MTKTTALLVLCAAVSLCGHPAYADTITVGPGRQYKDLELANHFAKPGDVVLVYPREGNKPYEEVAVLVRKPGVTWRGVLGKNGERVKLSGEGYLYRGVSSIPRAVFQLDARAHGGVVENFEIFGARNKEHNAAGVRINQANNITIRNCDIHHNDDGIMSNGNGTLTSAFSQRIEFCRIHHNARPGGKGINHNVYLGGASATIHGCEIFAAKLGHNIKSRAHYTRVEYSYIHHGADREFDFVDGLETQFAGAYAVLIGNVIVKGEPYARNKNVVHFGTDGGRVRNGTLYLIHNTIVTPFRSPVVDLTIRSARLRAVNNIICGTGRDQMLVHARRGARDRNVWGTHNRISATFGMIPTRFDRKTNWITRTPIRFVDEKNHNWRVASPTGEIIDRGMPWTTLDIPRIPPVPWKVEPKRPFSVDWQYKHPANVEKRTDTGAPDLGAFAVTRP